MEVSSKENHQTHRPFPQSDPSGARFRSAAKSIGVNQWKLGENFSKKRHRDWGNTVFPEKKNHAGKKMGNGGINEIKVP